MSHENSAAAVHWYVVHAQPRQELLVATLLEMRYPVTVFLPEVLHYRHGKSRLRPLFPGYLFVRCELTVVPPSAINTVPGVIRLLVGGDGPLTVAEEVIAALQQACTRINENGGLAAHTFTPGERVRLMAGPLAGLEAAFLKRAKSGDRALILLRFLNQESQVTVDLHLLEKVNPNWHGERQRSTRGAGRRINRPG